MECQVWLVLAFWSFIDLPKIYLHVMAAQTYERLWGHVFLLCQLRHCCPHYNPMVAIMPHIELPYPVAIFAGSSQRLSALFQ
jgi:hypothetical protein